ncbi:BatA domain-containing protein [Sunxiuqinia elliptica]|uniref:Putative membrane protein (TIGR02226 family) n=1 Tax=Sunxiuqinia elliptica TaxID=655355 RepID=A0A4R6GUS4_9BACT|nr:BatA domain-containing protein [Sunxiuqinia elliptica]TDN99083.1 putative membrane protein (TIGR02226 family) [Sunxiuqinia elliptica]TDO56523.1 putative membrane protein (TIGR02226 family) [Sunxiuqinia elliptica]
MKFIYPEFLVALLLIGIPILIHFLHFKRYKTVYFSQVNFLKTVKEESRKKNNLKQLLILLCRILTVAALVFVFSQPYFPTNKEAKNLAKKLVAIYVDNSFSMKQEGDQGILLEQAKSRAMEIAQSYGPATRFLLIDNQQQPESRQILSQSQLISKLGSIHESPVQLALSKIHQSLYNRLQQEGAKAEKNIYLISDFQSYATDLNAFIKDTSIYTYLIPLTGQSTNNLLIDSCWFETPGHKKNREEILSVRIQNQSNQSYQNVPVRLKINDTIKAINNLSIEPEATEEIQLTYKNNQAGIHRGIVELDDYPIVYDNHYYFSYTVQSKNRVLAISQPNDLTNSKLEALFKADENIDFETIAVNKIQVSQFKNYQCIYLLNLENLSSGLIGSLKQFVEQGGSLAVFPGINSQLSSYNQLFAGLNAGRLVAADSTQLRMETVNYNHSLFDKVFLHEKQDLELPQVSYSFRTNTNSRSLETSLVEFNNRQSAVSEFHAGLGRLYQFNFPLDDEKTNFTQQAIFVPLIYNIALNSFAPQDIQYEIKNDLVLNLSFNEAQRPTNTQTLLLDNGKQQFRIPVINRLNNQLRIDPGQAIQQAGFYDLYSNEHQLRTLAFNFSREESRSSTQDAQQLNQVLSSLNNPTITIIEGSDSDFVQQLLIANEGTQLWKMFLFLALFFLAMEVLISRFWEIIVKR